ncbi:DUF4403 family protein [Algoriphagus sp. H41]|uniref:DUF4403 family protein n=1 Tax=Algoriphagus oliviformis TaxID=2811231 RepID=A0ABS3BZ47_9BACT|nr:DUF4403 family protein [Algoriphagus oliviformis]MBN7810132.1 DUF4403 family protein [Algoriphagus oliviformis]
MIIFCAITACKSLNPAATPPLARIPEAYSKVNLPLEIPVQTLENLVNQRVPPVLFEEQGMEMGNGIIGDLNFARNGMVNVAALDEHRMQLILPIRVRGELGLKPGGLRNLFQSKVPIDQAFAPVVVFDPQINPNWALGISDFEVLDLGGKMSLSVLGMELDLTQMIRQEIQRYADKNLTAKPDLLRLKPIVDQAWNQVGRPVFVEFEGKRMAFSIQPDSVKLSEKFTPGQSYDLSLGLSGKVNAHPVDAAPSRPFPLPKLTENHSEENFLEILIPLRLSYAEIDQLLSENFENQAIRVNKTTVFRPSNFRSQAYGEQLGIWMDFHAVQTDGKEIDGKLFLVGSPKFDPRERVLIFDQVNFHLDSDSRKAKMAASLKKGKIIRQLDKKLRFEMGEVLEESLSGIRERLALQTPYGDLRVVGLEIVPDGFYPSAAGLEIQLKATGQVEVEWR